MPRGPEGVRLAAIVAAKLTALRDAAESVRLSARPRLCPRRGRGRARGPRVPGARAAQARTPGPVIA